ncbi:Alpha/Beta hydrolase protein [Mortierella sp. GBAus27b]|nr:hypothetical protein BGX31_011691 [Mortierella sp. GBA43]KAI8348786.1 Alpha/Beta hydrolase protein [Mortierella sp. GBAus27b]
MPFVQPTGIAVGSRVTNLVKGFNNNELSHKHPEPEISCQVKNVWIRSVDDSMHIFTRTWTPVGTHVQSVVVFVHDVPEHCERYHPLFTQFAIKGIEVHSFDLPGFGETGFRADTRGITGGYNTLLKEIDSALDRASSAHSNKPLFLVGHGMGGALVLNYVCGLGQRIATLAGVVSSSPYLKPTLVGAGARFPRTYSLLSKWYPNVGVKFQILPEELTRDRAEQERHRSDGLIQESISLQCLGDMIYQGDKLLRKRCKKFPTPLPILLLHGTEDPIASYQASVALSNRLLKRQPTNFVFKSWKGSKHDPHWDIDADSVKNEVIHWIRDISRHFDKAPLEGYKVHSDGIKSFRSREKSRISNESRPKGKGKATKNDDGKSKDQVKDTEDKKCKKDTEKPSTAQHASQEQEPTEKPLDEQPVQQGTTSLAPNPIVEKAEEIQDLKGLLHQQQLREEKAKAKRLEYDLDANGGDKLGSTSTATIMSSTGDPTTVLQGDTKSGEASQHKTNILEDTIAEPLEATATMESEETGAQAEGREETTVPDTTSSDLQEPVSETNQPGQTADVSNPEGALQDNIPTAIESKEDTDQQPADAPRAASSEHHNTVGPTTADNSHIELVVGPVEECTNVDTQELVPQVSAPSSEAEVPDSTENCVVGIPVVERIDVVTD